MAPPNRFKYVKISPMFKKNFPPPQQPPYCLLTYFSPPCHKHVSCKSDPDSLSLLSHLIHSITLWSGFYPHHSTKTISIQLVPKPLINSLLLHPKHKLPIFNYLSGYCHCPSLRSMTPFVTDFPPFLWPFLFIFFWELHFPSDYFIHIDISFSLLTLNQLLSKNKRSLPHPHPGTFGNVCRHFGLSQLKEFWHLVNRGQGTCWTSYNVQDRPTAKNYPAPNINSA